MAIIFDLVGGRILDYWKGEGERPSREQAGDWLFDQARRTRSDACDFDPEMVRSLVPLDPSGFAATVRKPPR